MHVCVRGISMIHEQCSARCVMKCTCVLITQDACLPNTHIGDA